MSEMAKRAGLADMYSLFYGYASALQSPDPLGLGMMINGKSLDVQPPPTMAHIGIALAVGNTILLETLRDYSKVCQVDNEDAFQTVEQDLAKAKIDLQTPVVGALHDVIDQE
jgi:hypothetical protein